jgi:hypothetical protein
VPVWSARADGATRLGTDHSSRALLVGGLHINPRSERPAACPGLSRGRAIAMSYQRPMIRSAPRTVSQTTTNTVVSTMTAASRAIASKIPSSSR